MRSPFQSDKLRSSDVFCIVNPCLKNLVGHYFEYDRSLVAPARQRGYEVVILGHRHAEPAISEMMPLQKSFTRDIWHTYPSLKHLNANVDFFVCNLHFYRELRRALSKIKLTSNSVVFAHTFTTAQLLAWAWYAWSLPTKRAPQIVLLLRYQPAFYANRCAEWAFRILEHVSKRGRIRVASDSRRLAEQYARLTFIPVEEFPIPHTEHIGPSSEGSIAAEGVCKPLRFVSLGDARDEKGFLEILGAITILHRTQKLDRFEFVLQSNRAAPDVQAKIDEFSASNIPNVRLIPEALSSDQYYALLESADVVLLPYWRSIYEARTSGIFAEAVAAGKPVIVSEDTWMSDQLLKFGAGILCRDRDPGDLSRAICEISDNYLTASQFARERCREWSRVHNPDSLVAAVIKPSIEITTPERPRRIAVFYPWGDILERKGGASVRCNLMVDFLKDRAEEIRVLYPGRSPDSRIGNVKFESCGEQQLPRKLAKKVFESAWYILTFGRSRGQDHLLWYHVCHYGDRQFQLKIWDLVSWADIVFLEYTFWSRYVIDACKRRGIKVILTNYDVVAEQVTRSTLLHRLTLDAEVGALRKADHAISVSVADQQAFRQAGVETEVIPNPVNVDAVKFSLPKQLAITALEQLYDVRLPGKRVCLFVGSLFRPNVMAVDTIRKIAGLVDGMSSDRDICFVVVGGCAAPERHRNFVALGKVDDIVLRALYHIAGLVLLPLPFGTGVSVKTIEAMAARKPILGTRHAFRGLTIESGLHCIISDDFGEYPRLIREIFNDPEKQQELGKNARSFSEAYDYRRVYSRYLELTNLSASESNNGQSNTGTSFRENVLAVARRALERNNPAISNTALSLLLESDRRDGEAHYLMARSFHQSGVNRQAALEHYDSSLECNYDAFLVRVDRSRLLREMKRPEAAQEDLSQVALMASADNWTAEKFGVFKGAIWKLSETAEDDLVLSLIPPMIAMYPRSGELHYLMAYSLHRLGDDPQRAFEYYTRAMELGFEEFLVRLNRGCLLRDQLNRLSESYADAKRAIELKPEDPQARTNYTQVLYLLGDDPALANRRWPLRLRNWLLRKLRAAMGAYLSIDVLKGHTDEKISALMNHIDQQMNGLNERMDQSEELKGYIDQQTAELRRHIGVEMAALMERVREFTGLTSRVDGVTSALQDIDRLRNESSKLSNTIEQVQAQFPLLYDRLNKLALSNEDYSLDMISMRLSGLDCTRLVKLTIATASPLAVESDDYKFPRGAKNDNTRHPRFVVKSEKVFDRKLFHLDLGCAGGGLVWDFILAGHQSYGIDGSDYSQVNRRAIWRVLPGNLFTADITKPFYFVDESGIRRRFDLITAWEVLEHLSEASLCGLFRNLHDNLSESGLFVASIATFEDADCAIGAVYHLTVKPWSWWAEQFRVAGFEIVEGPYEPKDFVRGSGNPRADDWDVTTAPELGFHLVVRKR